MYENIKLLWIEILVLVKEGREGQREREGRIVARVKGLPVGTREAEEAFSKGQQS